MTSLISTKEILRIPTILRFNCAAVKIKIKLCKNELAMNTINNYYRYTLAERKIGEQLNV